MLVGLRVLGFWAPGVRGQGWAVEGFSQGWGSGFGGLGVLGVQGLGLEGFRV